MVLQYPENDLEATLKKAFVDYGALCIVFDKDVAENKLVISSIKHGLNKGWLYEESADAQRWDEALYMLTDKGKEHFNLL